MPEPASIRTEEFINAFDYRDPEPPPGVPIAFAWELARELTSSRFRLGPALEVEGLGRAAAALVANGDPYTYAGVTISASRSQQSGAPMTSVSARVYLPLANPLLSSSGAAADLPTRK